MSKMNVARSRLLEGIDIFGTAINIRFDKKAFHRTQIGGLVTIVILFLMVYQLNIIINNLSDTTNPTVLYEQTYTVSPERYDLTPDKFSFMFGLQDPNSQHYMDPTVYNATLWMKQTHKILDPTTGDYVTQWNNRVIQTEPCTKDHFQVVGAQQYFLNLKFTSMYCISLQESGIYIEGEFDANAYSGIEIVIQQCAGPTCASPSVIQSKLNNGRLAVYYIDHAVIPSDYKNPFQPLGRQSFWVSGPQFTKELNISVRNSYLNTDVGFINPDIQQTKTLTWSFDREQVAPQTGNILYDCYFSFEKNLNSNYKRSYMKLDRAVSQIGGAFNVLFAIGCVLCRPLSQLDLNRQLIRDIFNVEDEDDDSQDNQDQKTANQKQKQLGDEYCDTNEYSKARMPNVNPILGRQMKQFNAPDSVKEIDDRSRTISFYAPTKNVSNIPSYQRTPAKMGTREVKAPMNLQNISFTESEQPDQMFTSKPVTKSKSMSTSDKSSKNNNIENFFSQKSKGLQFKGFEFFVNFFKCSNVCRSRKEKLLQKGVDKLYNHIDIFFLINKLLEVEKLKYLLLNEDQIKLFEFIPKPTLSMSERKSQSVSDKIGLLNENNKSEEQKTRDAFDSFKKIVNKGGSVSKIDIRLVELLDTRFKNILKLQDSTSGILDFNFSKFMQSVVQSKESKRKVKVHTPDEEEERGYTAAPTDLCVTDQFQPTLSESVNGIMGHYQQKTKQNCIYTLDQQ